MTELETFMNLISGKGNYIIIQPKEIHETYVHFKNSMNETLLTFVFDRNEKLKVIV